MSSSDPSENLDSDATSAHDAETDAASLADSIEVDLPDSDNQAATGALSRKRAGGGKLVRNAVAAIFLLGILLVALQFFFGGNDAPAVNTGSNVRSVVALEDEGAGEFRDERVRRQAELAREQDEQRVRDSRVRSNETLIGFEDGQADMSFLSERSEDNSGDHNENPDEPRDFFAEAEAARIESERRAKQEQEQRERERIERQEQRRQQFSSRQASMNNHPPRMPASNQRQSEPGNSPPQAEIPRQNQEAQRVPSTRQTQGSGHHSPNRQAGPGLGGQSANAAISRLIDQSSGASGSSRNLPGQGVRHNEHLRTANRERLSGEPGSESTSSELLNHAGFRFSDPEIEEEVEPRVRTYHRTGQLSLGFMEGRLDSDVPSAVVVTEILDGPLAGGKLIGNHAFEGECIIVNFSQLQWRGFDVGINAAAADPETGQACLSGRVNYRVFQRYGVPLIFSLARIGVDYNRQRNTGTETYIDEDGRERVRHRQDALGFSDYALREASDTALDAAEEPARRYADQPIQITREPSVIGIRWLSNVEIDLSAD